MHWIKNRFQRYRQLSPWDFCWRIAIEGTIVSLFAAILLSVAGAPYREMDYDPAVILISGLFAAPILETLLLQALPVWIARRRNARFSTQMICSIVPWTILHALEGIQTGIAAGLIGGFYFAFTYVHWREKSRWTAYWVTALSHFIHNALVLGLALALGQL